MYHIPYLIYYILYIIFYILHTTYHILHIENPVTQLWDLIETWGLLGDIRDIVPEDAKDVDDVVDDDEDDDDIGEDSEEEKYIYIFLKVSSVISFRNHKLDLI